MLSIQIDPKTLISLTSICPFLQALWKRIFPIFRCCTVIRYFKVLDKEGLKAKNDIYWQKLHCLLRTSVWYWINQGRSLSGKNREKQTFPASELALQIPILPLIDFGCDRITDFRKPPRLLDTKKNDRIYGLTQYFQRMCDLNWVSQDWYFAGVVASVSRIDITQFECVIGE